MITLSSFVALTLNTGGQTIVSLPRYAEFLCVAATRPMPELKKDPWNRHYLARTNGHIQVHFLVDPNQPCEDREFWALDARDPGDFFAMMPWTLAPGRAQYRGSADPFGDGPTYHVFERLQPDGEPDGELDVQLLDQVAEELAK